MHIVDVAEFYAPLGGGVKTYIDSKLAFAAGSGDRVTVIAPGPENHVERRPGGEVIFVQAPAIPFDRRYHLFVKSAPVHRLLDALSPDVVEASSPFRGASIVAGWQGPAAGRARRSLFLHADPVAAHLHVLAGKLVSPEQLDRLARPYWRRLARLAGHFDHVVTTSRWFAGRVQENSTIRTEMLPLGVDQSLFHPGKRCPTLRRQLLADCGLPEQGHLLVGVGRHHHEKRWPMLFGAVGALRQQQVAMMQIGSGFASARVEKAAMAAGNVRLLGEIRDRERLAAILASADAMLHGSSAETFGLVASEGLASGLPLILPDRGGCTDVANPAWSESYAAGSAAAATDAIRRLLTRPQAELCQQAHAARTLAILPPDEHFRRLFRLYGRGRDKAPATLPVAA